MLHPQLYALAILAVQASAAGPSRLYSSAGNASVNSEEDAALITANEHHANVLAGSGDPNESFDCMATYSAMSKEEEASPSGTQSNTSTFVPETLPNVKDFFKLDPHIFVDIDRVFDKDEIEAGARNLLAATKSYIAISNTSASKKKPVTISEIFRTDLNRKFSITSLPQPLSQIALQILHFCRKLETDLLDTSMHSNRKWSRTMRQAANAIKINTLTDSLTCETKSALSLLLRSTNSVVLSALQSRYVKRAAELYHAELSAELDNLFLEERIKYQEYMQSLIQSKSTDRYSMAVIVIDTVFLSNSFAVKSLEIETVILMNEEKSLIAEKTRTISDIVIFFREFLHENPWIADFDAPIDPETLDSAGFKLLSIADNLSIHSTNLLAVTNRKMDVSERKMILDFHKKILNARANDALDLLKVFGTTFSDKEFSHAKVFVNELLSTGGISRPLEDYEREIVAVVDKITGVRHRVNVPVLQSAPAAARWDEERKFECMQHLDASIAEADVQGQSHIGQIDEAVSTLENALIHFKSLLKERVELFKSMCDMINKPEGRVSMGAMGRRYKEVRLELEAAKDSIGKKMKEINEPVLKQAEYEGAIAFKDAAQSIIGPLRGDIAAAETIEAVNRSISKAAEFADQQEMSAKNQASIQAKNITALSSNAERDQSAWFEAFSRIPTHTNRLEGILNTAFKANRALDEGELRQTGIRLENMVKITANIIAHVDLEQSALAEKRAADINHAVAIARAAAFAKLSTQSRLKAIIFDGSSQ